MAMSEAAKEARREYKRRWNRSNPDKVAQHQRTYWERKAAKEQQGEPLQKEV